MPNPKAGGGGTVDLKTAVSRSSKQIRLCIWDQFERRRKKRALQMPHEFTNEGLSFVENTARERPLKFVATNWK